MFRDCKSGGYNLEAFGANQQLLTNITSKMSYLQNNPSHKVQKLCQQLQFILKYV